MMIAHPPVPPHEHQPWGDQYDPMNMSMEEEELLDICDHVQRHSNIAMPPKEAPKEAFKPVVQEVPQASTQQEQEPQEEREEEDVDDSDSLAEDQARLCAIKREAINLLSAAHKSTSGSARIQAMTLLAALYKAETKQDLAVLGEKVQELLLEKKKQDAEMERLRAEEEANRVPERFSRIRATVSRMVHNSDSRSVNSAPTLRRNSGQRGWRFFWQRDAAAEARRPSHNSGIHGIAVPADRNARLQSLSQRQKIWDTRTL